MLSGSQRSGIAADLVLQTQLFVGDRYKEQLDEKKHTENTLLLPLSPASLSTTGSLPSFFQLNSLLLGIALGLR